MCVCVCVYERERKRGSEPNINLRLNKGCRAICFESGQQRIICYHWQQVDRTSKAVFKAGAAVCFLT